MRKMNKSVLKNKPKKSLMKNANAKNLSKLLKRKKPGKSDWENLRKVPKKKLFRKMSRQKYKRKSSLQMSPSHRLSNIKSLPLLKLSLLIWRSRNLIMLNSQKSLNLYSLRKKKSSKSLKCQKSLLMNSIESKESSNNGSKSFNKERSKS